MPLPLGPVLDESPLAGALADSGLLGVSVPVLFVLLLGILMHRLGMPRWSWWRRRMKSVQLHRSLIGLVAGGAIGALAALVGMVSGPGFVLASPGLFLMEVIGADTLGIAMEGHWPSPLGIVLTNVAAYGALGGFIGLVAKRHSKRETGPLRCTQCGYNLTGLPEPRCPECGTKFDPHATERPDDDAFDS